MNPQTLSRDTLLHQLRAARRWDIAIVGGGATGCGIALDAVMRGFSVVLVESHDFAKGTSSRATKLAHGGVRYLAQGNVALVREALVERTAMLANAPHLAQRLPFVMPSYRLWETGFYGVGLKLYDALAGSRGLGPTEFLGAARARELLPGVNPRGLVGGVKYWDGQFDDARLCLAIARTAASHGALLVNRCAAVALHRHAGKINGLDVQDAETGERFSLDAGCVINATGVWVDALRDMDRDEGSPVRAPMVSPSQGVHLVVDRDFLPGQHAMLVPKTEDGRVLFAVPWLGKTILGTTDTPRGDLAREPVPFADEVAFILREAGRYLARPPQREDVRSIWVGLRPLVKPSSDEGESTKALSREHTVIVGRSGLVTVTGGKWTTYRAMAEDVLQRAMSRGVLQHKAGGRTEHLPLIGAAPGRPMGEPPGEHLYGSEAAALRTLPGADRWIWRDGNGGLSEAMVRFAARFEMARDVEDVLARRSRLLFLDAAEASAVADSVATLVQEETGRSSDIDAFKALATQYRTLP